jgi:predicted RNase H-like HicB family nuclease
MNSAFTAIVKKDGDWWIGWIEEVPGVNAQEETKEKLLSSLKEILGEALEFNRSEARQAAENNYTEEAIAV